MKKTLILVGCGHKYFFPYVCSDKCDIYSHYRSFRYLFPRVIRRKYPYLHFYRYGKKEEWSNNLNQYDKVIMFEGGYSYSFNKYINRGYFPRGAYVYFWNKLNGDIKKEKLFLKKLKKNKNIKICSYNQDDCEKNDLKFVSTVAESIFEDKIEMVQKKYNIKYDIMFVGSIKGNRVKELDEIAGELKKRGFELWIDIKKIGPSKMKYIKVNNFEFSDNAKTYFENVQAILQSKAILDVDVYKEKAVNTRAIEALIYKKKYITNNVNIAEEPFYSSDNIFIWGKDDVNQLDEFLNTPYMEPEVDWVKYFSFDEWINRFD